MINLLNLFDMKPFWKILIVVLSTVIEAIKDIFDKDEIKALQS